MRARRAFAFSVLEILIAVSIFSLALGGIVYKGAALLEEYRLSSAVSLLARETKHARMLSLTYNTDVWLRLRKDRDWMLEIYSEEPALNNQEKIILRGMHQILVNGISCASTALHFSCGVCIAPPRLECVGKRTSLLFAP